jgi:hypothetical protein
METSFRLDQWMLRFLSEFAQPVGDKYSENFGSNSWRVEDIDTSPSHFPNFSIA